MWDCFIIIIADLLLESFRRQVMIGFLELGTCRWSMILGDGVQLLWMSTDTVIIGQVLRLTGRSAIAYNQHDALLETSEAAWELASCDHNKVHGRVVVHGGILQWL